jgi:hypothetical protein
MTEYYRTLEKQEVESLAQKCRHFLSVMPNGWRFTRAAKRSGAASGASAG